MSSKLLEKAVTEMGDLPGIGKRTALRLVLHLLRQPEGQTESLVEALQEFQSGIQQRRECHNISDSECCEICSSSKRDRTLICVVEDIRDVMAIENTGHYRAFIPRTGG